MRVMHMVLEVECVLVHDPSYTCEVKGPTKHQQLTWLSLAYVYTRPIRVLVAKSRTNWMT